MYLIDLRQLPKMYYGEHVQQCRIDPTTLIEHHDDALNMATWLHRVANLALGGRVTAHSEPYWAAQIIPALAGVLYAASPKGNGKGIDWALHCVENPYEDEPAPDPAEFALKLRVAKALVAELDKDPNAKDSAKALAELELLKAEKAWEAAQGAADHAAIGNGDLRRQMRQDAGEDLAAIYSSDPPSWWDVRQYFSQHSIIPSKLERVAKLSDRQRDSVGLGMSAALFPWVYESVRQSDLPIFDPKLLDDPTATLFILAEPEGGGVGAALPLVQSIVAAWRRKTSEGVLEHNVFLAIDELTNTLPLPTLDVLVSEARGLGINLMAAVQASKQIGHRYDPVFMDTLLSIFPVMLALHGSAELEVLEQGSTWSGITTRAKETYDQTNGNRVTSVEEGPLLLPVELQPTAKFRGRLIYRGSVGIEVELPSFGQFLKLFDDQSIEGMVRV
ncbi:MAG: TraM recognition domain-containing protein [Mycolicibacterium sp.]|uniref:TraM recognition domain-containing protein n=1 Tax=Mycolicibacterium sp. TaxID=2320850 RepID=UPI003D0E7D54